ncbi:MAG TPA: hypothetical protein VGF13_01910 [Verrucomicrobiae bacterium]|jgi:hypothetical protein
MVTATSNVIEKYNSTWQNHEAFADSVETLGEKVSQIDEQVEISHGNPGAAQKKEQVRKELCVSACEVIGAVRSYATKNDDPELLARVSYSASDVTAGKSSDVVARCKAIWSAAAGVVADLGKYGITPAKLTLLKKRIDAFDAAKVAPRQNRVKKSAAGQLLRKLVRESVNILRDELDGLMVQFQSAAPNFYQEYFAARVVVDSRGARPEEPNVMPVNGESLPKAA